MTKIDQELYAAVLQADSSMTTCTATFAGSDKEYTYQVSKSLARTLVPGDLLLVDHNTHDRFQLVTLVQVDLIPNCYWSTKTRSVIMGISNHALREAKDAIDEYRQDLYDTAKAHLDNKMSQELLTAQQVMQDELGINSFFKQQ